MKATGGSSRIWLSLSQGVRPRARAGGRTSQKVSFSFVTITHGEFQTHGEIQNPFYEHIYNNQPSKTIRSEDRHCI